MPRNSTSLTPKALLDAKTCPSVLLITCTQHLRITRLIDKIIAKFGPPSGKAQISHFKGKELTSDKVRELRDDLLTISLFPEPRFFLVDGCDELTDANAKVLTKICIDLPSHTYIIFSSKSLPAAHPITQLCKQTQAIIVLEKLEGEDLAKWTRAELTAGGIKEFPAELPSAVIQLASGEPDAIHTIINQLSLYIEDNHATLKDLHDLFPLTPDPSEFELVDACSDSNPARPELVFQQLAKQGKSPFMLLAIISRVFTNFRGIRHLLSKGHSESQVRQALNMTPWVYNKNLSAAKKYKTISLESHSHAIIKCDSKLKNRSLGAEIVFSELFARLKP